MRCNHVEKSNGISKKSNELDVPGQGNLQAFEHRLDRCDYTICGDKDPYVKEHPEYQDENGYRRNK